MRGVDGVKERKSYKIAAQCLAVAILLLIFASCLSFNVADWPSPFTYPNNEPAVNLCGPVGAFCAYYLFYYLGPGVYVVLISSISYVIVKLINRDIHQLILRIIGMGLLTIGISCSFYFFWPNGFNTFPRGSGGVLGIGIDQFLSSKFATFGTFVLISATCLVGLILLGDTLFLSALHWAGTAINKVFGVTMPAWSAAKGHSQALGDIWKKLSVMEKFDALKQKTGITSAQTGMASDQKVMNIESDIEIEKSFDRSRSIVGEDFVPGQVQLPKEVKNKEPKAAKPAAEKRYVPKSYEDYTFPPLELLDEPEVGYGDVQGKIVKNKAAELESLLSEFNINAVVVAAETGPVVTMFELELGAGVKVSQISTLSNDIARALGAGAVRVVAPLPGKHTIGIEVPNNEKEKVRIKELIQIVGSKADQMNIPLFLGKDSTGQVLAPDLTSMPHLLIAGTTGSGKSVCINSIISSILLTRRPDEVQMIMVDPKMVEMAAFNTVPHLMSPIVTEMHRATQILEWATVKMDERYAILAEAKVKNISDYNKLGTAEILARFNPTTEDEEAMIPKRLPYIVIIIDELADLMMTGAKETEAFIVRLAQKSRAVGIHLVLATQRPQATVVTGLIKSNMPCRIGFRVAARMDSRIILDHNGAETLLGQGDMLFLKPGTSDLIRAQCTYLDDAEIRKIVKYLKDVAEPQFHPELQQLGKVDVSQMKHDDMFDDAVRIVLESKRGSVSLLQRRLGIGYARASRMIEMMASSGVLGEYKGSQAREVLLTLDEYERMREQMNKDASEGYAYTDQDQTQDTPAMHTSQGPQEYMASDEDELEEDDDQA